MIYALFVLYVKKEADFVSPEKENAEIGNIVTIIILVI